MPILSSQDTFDMFVKQLQDFLILLISGEQSIENMQFEASLLLDDFGVNSSLLTANHENILEQLCTLILEQDIDSDGNTSITRLIELDALVGRASQTGNEDNNLELSDARAKSVKAFLHLHGLVYYPTIIPLGSSDPLVDSAQDEAAINRSVSIKILISFNLQHIEQSLDFWDDIAQHSLPQTVQDELTARNFTLQTLATADPNSRTNLDFFQIKIRSMPINSSGNAYSMAELFNELRLNLSDLIALTHSNSNQFAPILVSDSTADALIKAVGTFAAHTTFKAFSPQDKSKWESSDPLGAVMQFDSVEDMGVICSYYQPDKWIFSTIGDHPITGDVGSHPVSGHRQFGYFVDASGENIIYTKGIDRTTYILGVDSEIPYFEAALDEGIFTGGQFIWLSLQVGVMLYIKERGGDAEVLRPVSNRRDHEQIQSHFFGP